MLHVKTDTVKRRETMSPLRGPHESAALDLIAAARVLQGANVEYEISKLRRKEANSLLTKHHRQV